MVVRVGMGGMVREVDVDLVLVVVAGKWDWRGWVWHHDVYGSLHVIFE